MFWRSGKADEQLRWRALDIPIRFCSEGKNHTVVWLQNSDPGFIAAGDWTTVCELANMTCQIPQTNLEGIRKTLVEATSSILIEAVLPALDQWENCLSACVKPKYAVTHKTI